MEIFEWKDRVSYNVLYGRIGRLYVILAELHHVNSGAKAWNNWPSAWNYFGTFSISVLMKVARIYQKDCTLCWDVYIICICNVLISLSCHYKESCLQHLRPWGSEVAECSILCVE
jgi:hypothetical protein